LRANIALVKPGRRLVYDTVAANIAYGAMRDTQRDGIIAAAEAAHAMEFIRQMPQGMQTLVGETESSCQSGQRQRCHCARTAQNAPVLILDEQLRRSIPSRSVTCRRRSRTLIGRRTT